MFFILYKPHRKLSPKRKHEVPIDDPITSLAVVARQISRDPLEVLWDDTFFEINTDLPLYIYMSDLLEFVVENQELNINIIHFFYDVSIFTYITIYFLLNYY